MSNKALFQSATRLGRLADTKNAAGGAAFKLESREALAKYAVTNTFGGTFYNTAEMQLEQLKALVDDVDDAFVAHLAVYARTQALMKDMPAYLLAVLVARQSPYVRQVFPLVVDTAKMLKNFVQIVRSGVTGRRSLGTAPKKLVQNWLRDRTTTQLLNDSVGGEPSLTDLLRMVHPRPSTEAQAALFAALLGKQVDEALLPTEYLALKAFHRGENASVPALSFQLLTGQALNSSQWTEIAKQASWQTTRMNLNTFLRQGVLADPAMVQMVAERLADPHLVRQSRVLPYQLLMAYLNVDPAMPQVIVSALHDALEIACEAVPSFNGKKVVIALDVSGSMKDPITGKRAGATSKARCVDVAALMASVLLRKNPTAKVVCFQDEIRQVRLEPRDTVMTNATRLAALAGGGTQCAVAMEHIAKHHPQADLIVFISDNESWSQYAGDRHAYFSRAPQVPLSELWARYRRQNTKAKMVLIDLTPSVDSQNYTQDRVLNVGGFSDAVFAALPGFLEPDGQGVGHWASLVMQTSLTMVTAPQDE